jgi:hypothetical protein
MSKMIEWTFFGSAAVRCPRLSSVNSMPRSAANLVDAELMMPVPPMKSTFITPPKAMISHEWSAIERAACG